MTKNLPPTTYYNKSPAVAEIGDHLAKIDISQKEEGGAVPFSGGGGTWAPSNTMWPGLRSTTVPSGILIHLATTDMGRKLGCMPLSRQGWVPI